MTIPFRRRCFVSMPFGGIFDVLYRDVIAPALRAANIECCRGDSSLEPGVVTEQIDKMIDEADFCLVDLTDFKPNVYIELGTIKAKNKPAFLLMQGKISPPFMVQPRRVLSYNPSEPESLKVLIQAIVETVFGSDDALLGNMLAPPSANSTARVVIAASPLPARESRRGRPGLDQLRKRTSGDEFGIVGLLQSLARISKAPDLINPNDYLDEVCLAPMNLYCIGSPKANRWTGTLLRTFCEVRSPALAFVADSDSDDLRDIHVSIRKNGVPLEASNPPKHSNRRMWDFGLVVRGPHPRDPGCMFLLIAGRSALGSEAAARLVTSPPKIRTLERMLAAAGVHLEDHKQPFWALACLGAHDDPNDDSTFVIDQVGRFTLR